MSSKANKVTLELAQGICTGCRACELACSFELYGVCNPKASRIKILLDTETGEIHSNLPIYCLDCANEGTTPCITACKTGALTLIKEN